MRRPRRRQKSKMLQAAQIPNAKPPSYFRKVDNLSLDTDTRLQEMEQILLREREQHSIAVQQLKAHGESEIAGLKEVISQLQNDAHVQASRHEQQLLAEATKSKAEQTALEQSFARESQEAKEKISHLECTLVAQTKQSESKCEQLEQRIRVLTDELDQTRNMLQHLQDSLVQDDKSQLERLTTENEQLQSSNELLQVRLTSLLAMFNIQEAAVAAKEGGAVLLSRWRQKVFTMMVQHKLLQNEQKKHQITVQQQVTGLQDKIKALEDDNKMLTHSLSDKNAQIKMHINQLNDVERKCNQLVTRNKQLVYQLTCQQHYLTETAASLHHYPGLMKQIVGMLDQFQSRVVGYEQRLSLATGRIATAYASLFHRQTLESSKVDNTSSCLDQLQSVSRDRDRLIEQLQQGAVLFEKQLQAEQHKFSDQKKMLEGQLVHLQSLNTSLQQEGKNLAGQVQKLQQQLIENQRKMEKAMETAVLEEKHYNNKKCAELEEVVSRLQVDIDKIELRLQQQQRLANREKEHAVQQIQLERDELKQQLHHCQQQLRSLQADRSLLISTLQQQPQHNTVTHASVQTMTTRRSSSSDSDITTTTDASCDRLDTDHSYHDGEDIKNALEELQELSACLINSNNN